VVDHSDSPLVTMLRVEVSQAGPRSEFAKPRMLEGAITRSFQNKEIQLQP